MARTSLFVARQPEQNADAEVEPSSSTYSRTLMAKSVDPEYLHGYSPAPA